MRAKKTADEENTSRGLWQQIQEDWIANGQVLTPGFQALALYRFGVWRMGLPTPLRKMATAIYGVLFAFVRNFYGIELVYTTRVGRRVVIAHQGNVVIHGNSEIGDDCLIRQNVTIGAARHDRVSEEAPKLGHGVQVGAGAVIMGKVRIGDGVRVGPNAVVMTNVPAGATVFATPARIIELPEIQQQPQAE